MKDLCMCIHRERESNLDKSKLKDPEKKFKLLNNLNYMLTQSEERNEFYDIRA